MSVFLERIPLIYLCVLHIDPEGGNDRLGCMAPRESRHVEHGNLSTAHKVLLVWVVRQGQSDIAHDEKGPDYVIKVVLQEILNCYGCLSC